MSSLDAAGGWLPLVVVVDPCWSGEASGQAALQKNLPPSALLPPDRPVRCAHEHDEAITHTQAARRAVASIASPACSYRHGHLNCLHPRRRRWAARCWPRRQALRLGSENEAGPGLERRADRRGIRGSSDVSLYWLLCLRQSSAASTLPVNIYQGRALL